MDDPALEKHETTEEELKKEEKCMTTQVGETAVKKSRTRRRSR